MKKKKWLGSLLNFLVPGLGNAYGRNLKKGILHYILFFVVVLSLRFIAYSFPLFIASLTLIIAYYLFLIISGYRDIKKDKVYEPERFDRWYIYILIIIFHMAVGNSLDRRTLDRLTPINFANIPTPAMEPSLLVGDRLAYKKTNSIDRKDVAIFWYPYERQTRYVKRCIGLPGDSLQIKGSSVFVNGMLSEDIPLKFRYHVTTDGSKINSRILKKHEIEENDYYMVSPDSYVFFLTKKQSKALKELVFLKNVELSLATDGEPESRIYPKSENLTWNADFYGPIYIPKKDDKIQLTPNNIDLYLQCFEFENDLVELDNSELRINGQVVTQYQFKQNYYFMMGDSRHNSLDSRYWGLLPQELVIGKAMYIYWGQKNERIGKEVI